MSMAKALIQVSQLGNKTKDKEKNENLRVLKEEKKLENSSLFYSGKNTRDILFFNM